jgi:hypothetical protein
MRMFSRLGSITVMLSAGIFFGCGGGGGSIPEGSPSGAEIPENRVLEGAYELIELLFVNGLPTSRLGTITFDEQGNYTVDGQLSRADSGANQDFAETGTYEVDEQGSFSLIRADENVLSGAIVYSGDLFIYSNIGEAGEQSIGIGLKTLESGHSNSSLAGAYRLADLSFSEEKAASLVAAIDFDGAGEYQLSGRYSRTGMEADKPIAGGGSYTVHTDGTGFSFNAMGENELQGAISVRNNLFIYAKVSDENEQSVGLGIKAGSSGHANSSLAGEYEVVDFTSAWDWAVSSLAVMSFDGAGSYTMAGGYSESGFAADQRFEGSGSYTVGNDGTFSFTPLIGAARHGAISPTGDLFIYGKITDAGEQSIGVAVRK